MICTGSRKTGTHALHRMVSLFGIQAEHLHIKHKDKSGNDYIHIIRHPKNVLVSWVRHRGLEVTEDNLLKESELMINEMWLYQPWLNEPILTVRFESLFTPETLNEIARYLNRSPIENHLEKAWGNTQTFTGKLSNWRNYWTERLEANWTKLSGDYLEEKLGYCK